MSLINIANLDFNPGGGSTPTGKIVINENGTYDVTEKATAEVNVPEPILQEKTINPVALTSVTVTADEGYDGLQSITVEAVDANIDSNIQARNIKKDVTILGVTGTLESGGDPDYRHMNGTVDYAGLRAIGWTDEDILRYEQNNPHYGWQNDQFTVSEENKALYGVYTNQTIGDIVYNSNGQFVPKVSGPIYSNRAFRNNPYVKGYPMLEFSGDYAEELFANSPNLTTIPPFIIPAWDWIKMFKDCKSLRNIPLLDSSHVRTMNSMFNGCSSLTSIPQLDTQNVDNMYLMFGGCSSLTSIPLLNTSKVTSMQSMFSGCSSLTTIPLLDTSNVTDMVAMFNNCSSLTSIPLLNTQNVTGMQSMFNNCSSLTSIPLLDTQNVTTMLNMFYGCSKLTSIPLLDTSNVKNMSGTFRGCTSLTTIPRLDTSKVNTMSSMFADCGTTLTTVEGIDFSGFTTQNVANLFGYTQSMTKLTRFIVNGKINVSISDNYSIKALTVIDYDSVKSILEAADRTDNANKAKTLAFNRTMQDPNGELTSLVASCTTKGWTINGLTLTA